MIDAGSLRCASVRVLEPFRSSSRQMLLFCELSDLAHGGVIYGDEIPQSCDVNIDVSVKSRMVLI